MSARLLDETGWRILDALQANARIPFAELGRQVGLSARAVAERVAKWWLPDTYAVIDEVPKTSVGKFDKKVLRQRMEDGELETTSVEEATA